MSVNPKIVLLIRLDRIGDLLSTLPVDELPCLNGASIKWYITQGLGFLMDHRDPKREYNEVTRKFQLRSFFAFIKNVKQLNPDTAIVFHAPWWVSLALFLAKVPLRIGRLSQWHSFLFFNRGIRQSRSEAVMHEFDYNVDLVCKGLGAEIPDTRTLWARLHHPQPAMVQAHLHLPEYYVVVHPGMAGSARNWPVDYYVESIKKISGEVNVVITGTKADDKWLKPLKTRLAECKNVRWFDDQLSGSELIAVLSQAKAVIAPSTGVVHVAAACGVKTIGIYSPVRVQSSKRWAPRGPKAQSLSPSVDCPAVHKCLGERCPHFDCMKNISIEAAVEVL